MLNLLQSRVSGVSESVNQLNGNNAHFLNRNLQNNGNFRTEHFDEHLTIEQITNGDKIAYIKIQDDIQSTPTIKSNVRRRSQFQRFFQHKYPDFFRQYCMCMHAKVEPDDLNTVSGITNDNYTDKYDNNSFLLNHTQIIPITVHPPKYEYASQSKSPKLDDRKHFTEELNRKNTQRNDIEKLSIGSGITTKRSQSFIVTTPNKIDDDDDNDNNSKIHQHDNENSDDDDISVGGESTRKRPLSHASTATTKSIRDEASSPALDSRSKSACSAGQSSIDEINTPKSHTSNENLHINKDDTVHTSLEHIQNESNEKLIADETKHNDVASMKITDDDRDTIDGGEQTDEIVIKSQPEQLLNAPFVSIRKRNELDDNEPRSETDSISLTSTEESSDYHALRNNTAKTITVPICDQNKILNKPIPKIRPSMISRRIKIAPVKAYPLSATTTSTSNKNNEIFSQTLRHFDKPREASNNCLSQLDSPNWESIMNGLQHFVRLIRHHPEIVENHLHAYVVALSKQVKNLRSQVSRSACQASAEFFQTHAKHLETECEDLATQLLNRTADTNKFLRADAFRALASMCDNLTPTKVIQVILTRGATHQNAIVRTATANLCSRIVGRLGCEKIFGMSREHRDKLIIAGANFLMEGSLDTRNHAKALFKQLSTHPQYNRTIKDVIPARIYRNIEKALRSIK